MTWLTSLLSAWIIPTDLTVEVTFEDIIADLEYGR